MVASVLAELVEALEPERLLAAASLCPIAWVQRLGHLLDLGGHAEVADALVPFVAQRVRGVAPLVRARTKSGAARGARWRLVVNADVEVEP